MAYFGWVRRRRLEYAAATYAPPVWLPYVHERRAPIEALKAEFPHVKVWVIDDERQN